uniref:Sulfide:quinone oxidoreductase, mitochondrial n=1 Tax=Urechis unicinctus TaxID=6432 RepID=H2KXA2_UREUN|nr:sulfide-quinine oxidoreductase [Urechis unicinctus]
MACTRTVFLRLSCSVRDKWSPKALGCQVAWFSSSPAREQQEKKYDIVIVGGGCAGSAIANKFAPYLGQGKVAVVEPHETHYYQPMFTLVGAGIKDHKQTHTQTKDVLPDECDWIKDKVTSFDPNNNSVTTAGGDKLKYDYLLVSMGLQLNYHSVKGLEEALKEDPAVCSNYHWQHVKKTHPAIENIQSGNAIFTFPNTPVKCAGAPQKICYLAENNFSKAGKRDRINVMYNTSLPVIFGIPRYAAPLEEICKNRNITVNKRHNLVEVDHKNNRAVFQLLDTPTENVSFEYSMLHVSPPMSSPKELWGSSLVDETNFVTVNRDTLQHTKYPNVFGMGDCTNAPTAKTAAAISAQVGVVNKNLSLVMDGKQPTRKYDGYTSCPLLVGNHKVIMAEFGYDGSILETFPINQAKAMRSMYFMKVHFMPQLYWQMLVKGLWHGPGFFRKLFRFGVA